jgi:ketosteroid isomerase-like protein
MNTMSDSPEVELLHRAFEAMTYGDFAVLEATLAEDAKWRTVDELVPQCRTSRRAIHRSGCSEHTLRRARESAK